MPNLESFMENVAETVNDNKGGEVFFTSLDMQYAYGQTTLHPETTKHCNIQIVGGESTGTYAFNTGYYGPAVGLPRSSINWIIYYKRQRIYSLFYFPTHIFNGTLKHEISHGKLDEDQNEVPSALLWG